MACDFASALVELEAFGWLPDTELELHAASASAPISRGTRMVRRPLRGPCIVRPPVSAKVEDVGTVPRVGWPPTLVLLRNMCQERIATI